MRLAIISDIHEDLFSLRRAIQLLKMKGYDYLACLGDICGYQQQSFLFNGIPNASGCIEIIRSECDIAISGNHDLFAAGKTTRFKAGQNIPKNWHTLSPQERLDQTEGKMWVYADEEDNNLTKEDIQWLRTLPEQAVVDGGDFNILLTHFLYPDISGSFVFKPELLEHFNGHFRYMDEKDSFISFSGHSHSPGALLADQRALFQYDIGEKKINLRKSWITGPAVVKSHKGSGCIIFDTESLSLDVIRID